MQSASYCGGRPRPQLCAVVAWPRTGGGEGAGGGGGAAAAAAAGRPFCGLDLARRQRIGAASRRRPWPAAAPLAGAAAAAAG